MTNPRASIPIKMQRVRILGCSWGSEVQNQSDCAEASVQRSWRVQDPLEIWDFGTGELLPL
eukprot:5989571-Amphidinium_carterae.1